MDSFLGVPGGFRRSRNSTWMYKSTSLLLLLLKHWAVITIYLWRTRTTNGDTTAIVSTMVGRRRIQHPHADDLKGLPLCPSTRTTVTIAITAITTITALAAAARNQCIVTIGPWRRDSRRNTLFISWKTVIFGIWMNLKCRIFGYVCVVSKQGKDAAETSEHAWLTIHVAGRRNSYTWGATLYFLTCFIKWIKLQKGKCCLKRPGWLDSWSASNRSPNDDKILQHLAKCFKAIMTHEVRKQNAKMRGP